ncbi:MAG: efflux RND transporter permease subunit [Thermodesulfobacteriota bacterium]
MKLIELSVRYPVSVAVGVILVLMFGILSLIAVPVQLTPDVDRPTISVQTIWRGASPEEIEREIVERQEKELKSVEGLVRLTSESVNDMGTVTLEFEVGADIDAALLRVSNKLQQVPRYPVNADKPVLTSASANAPPIAWMSILPKGPKAPPIETIRTFVKERVLPLIERVPGVAAANTYGGRDLEMQAVVDPRKAAAHGLTMSQIAARLRGDNLDLSAGGLDEGKRRYVVRTKSRFHEPQDMADVVLAYDKGAPVFLRDVGEPRLGYSPRDAVVLNFGRPTVVMNAIRETGTNVLTVMAGLKKALAEINRDLLDDLDLAVRQVYDETEYIEQAIALVKDNIYLGGSLAVLVLLLFLRSLSTTFIIALAIPISIVGTFIMMAAFGRNLNVISLAGLAFASGMVVDNSIVVLENIFRRRQTGEDRTTAAVAGARQVWGAVLASTLTTVAVFLPVLRIKQEAGQLFADIAIAVSFAVLISLIVSITVIPSLAARIVGGGREAAPPEGWRRRAQELFGLAAFAERFRLVVADSVHRMTGSVAVSALVMVGFTALSLGMAWFLAPKAEYLPTGNRNLVLGIMLPPPGYNVDQHEQTGRFVAEQWRGHWGQTPGVAGGAKEQPEIRNFFFVGWGAQIFMGVSTWDDDRAREMIPIMRRTLGQIPGMIPIVQQTSLFQRNVAQGRTIDLDLTGPDLARLVGLGGRLFGQIMAIIPGAQVRPVPSLDLSQPELRFIPDRVRAAAVNLTTEQIGLNLDVLVEGAKIDEVSRQGYSIDLKLMADPRFVDRTQDLGRMQVNSPLGRLVTLESVAPPRLVGGPTQINHIERRRAITLRVYPPEELPLQEAMDRLREQIVEPLRNRGEAAPPYDVGLSGTADDLTRTYEALRSNFMLALAITFLLMAALYESWLYPLVIMFSVPLAAAGGFLGLWLVNALLTYQALDVLTMLGFVILIGTVVNNAILLVDLALQGMRAEGMAPRDAIRQAVNLRVRPIFMTVLTTVFGMLPLVVFPGAGSELYRGLGAVMVGGLLVSTVFTLFLVPAVFNLVIQARLALSRRLGRPFRP